MLPLFAHAHLENTEVHLDHSGDLPLSPSFEMSAFAGLANHAVVRLDLVGRSQSLAKKSICRSYLNSTL
jgi:hypothetical protein